MSYSYDYPHPAVTTDIVIFTIRQDELKVLLIKRALPPHQGAWALPGGFVNLDESLEEGARRELAEETGVSGVYLEQLYTFGRPDRDPRERVITVAYYALIPTDTIEIRAATDAEGVSWFGMNELPELAFDHREILDMAQRRLVDKLDYSTIAFQFMPKEFTLPELQQVYELILGEALDKRNFRKRILSLGLVMETGKERKAGAHRPAKLYRSIHPDRVEVIK
ncbi:MAG: NUDIX hydrolase [Gammaproteobacteria bacterium]|nr:NUDIX hydrolase [Gammaproteobacteria bacterium]MDH3428968.1 NUDIX hydrolase [Gammaproteobacteria bacterium]MDH3433990.1 NUDIX hydrolase [Gammaproteobacteria bacterium]